MCEVSDRHKTGNLSGHGIGPQSVDGDDLSGPTTDDSNHAQIYVGGIAKSGHFGFTTSDSGLIWDCTSTGDITVTAAGWRAFAAGISSGSGRIANCAASGRLSASSAYAYAGGINAYAIGAYSITHCHFGGK
ncbi:MAG: hypothetical protein LBP80_11850 [Treponema sp.]|nr:hypothetical protein [Treponema sp.]